MQQSHKTLISFLILIFLLTGCEDDESQSINPIIITTENVNNGDIYINLISGEEVSSIQTWHFSIVKDTSNYNMPSIIMGNVDVAIYDDILFEDINLLPDNFDDMPLVNNESFTFGGENEILSYDITVHKVSVSNPDRIYVINSKNNLSNIIRLQFIEYQRGITVFHFI